LRVRTWFAAFVFQVAQEPEHPLEGEVGDAESGDLGALVGGDETQQDPHGVPVASHRSWT
jgi:hypothetical protein